MSGVVLAHPSERWEAADGAPMGPSFDLLIPSSRRSGSPLEYRIARDLMTGVLVHTPRCRAWSGGPILCSHVKQAIAQTEQPAAAFLALCRDKIGRSTYWANGEEAIRVLGEIKVAMEEAEDRIRLTAREERARAESEAFHALTPDEQMAEAVATWGERTGGRS